MPKLKLYRVYNDCDNLMLQIDLNYNDRSGDEKNIEWIQYRLCFVVENEEYIIEGFSMHKENLEQWISVMHKVIEERKTNTYFDEVAKKSISKVPNDQRTRISYQDFECCLGEELEFNIKMKNLEDFWDDVIVDFTIWMKAACIKGRKQGYSIGYNFVIKYDDLQKFCENIETQYKEIIDKK